MIKEKISSIKIAHESPLCIMDEIKKYTDYDYALVHLFEDPFKDLADNYYNYFVNSLNEGREVILDNSLFELGTYFNPSKFVHWINKLKPTYYVIPDVWENYPLTISECNEWFDKYKPILNTISKSIGVVQGEHIMDLFLCYEELSNNPNVDVIAINHSNTFKQFFSDPGYNKFTSEKLIMLGRMKFIDTLFVKGLINKNKKHHLLGCTIPSEFNFYASNYNNFNFIYSLDTSNPVLATIEGSKYDPRYGLDKKPNIKIVDVMGMSKKDINMELLEYNLNIFRSFL